MNEASRWHGAKNASNHPTLYLTVPALPLHPGMKGGDCHLSIDNTRYPTQHLAIKLANTWFTLEIQESLTVKIKTKKISETQILACFAKIYTRKNYQLYGIACGPCYCCWWIM